MHILLDPEVKRIAWRYAHVPGYETMPFTELEREAFTGFRNWINGVAMLDARFSLISRETLVRVLGTSDLDFIADPVPLSDCVLKGLCHFSYHRNEREEVLRLGLVGEGVLQEDTLSADRVEFVAGICGLEVRSRDYVSALANLQYARELPTSPPI